MARAQNNKPFMRSFIWLHDFTDGREKRGQYAADFAQFADWTPTNHQCPYCHEPMLLLDRTCVGRVHRIVDVGRVYKDQARQSATFMRIPETHRLLRCKACQLGFTQPSEVNATQSL